MNAKKTLGYVALVALVVLGGLGARAVVSSPEGRSPVQATGAPVASTTTVRPPTVTRSAVEGRVRALSAIVPQGSVLVSKLTTVEELLGVNLDARGIAALTENSSRPVWLVSVTGTGFRAQFAHGDTYDWGLMVIDAGSGEPLASFAGSDAPEAPYFDEIVDEAAAHDPES